MAAISASVQPASAKARDGGAAQIVERETNNTDSPARSRPSYLKAICSPRPALRRCDDNRANPRRCVEHRF
jgi:hypothetical protein